MNKDERYMVKKALECWLWIERKENNGRIDYDDKYDKHLLKKVKEIQKLVDKLLPDSDIADDTLVHTVERNLFGLHQFGELKWHRRAHFAFDVTKSFVHHYILRKFNYDPLIETLAYKKKVDKLLGD